MESAHYDPPIQFGAPLLPRERPASPQLDPFGIILEQGQIAFGNVERGEDEHEARPEAAEFFPGGASLMNSDRPRRALSADQARAMD